MGQIRREKNGKLQDWGDEDKLDNSMNAYRGLLDKAQCHGHYITWDLN